MMVGVVGELLSALSRQVVLTLGWTLDIATSAASTLEGAVWVVVLVVPHVGGAGGVWLQPGGYGWRSGSRGEQYLPVNCSKQTQTARVVYVATRRGLAEVQQLIRRWRPGRWRWRCELHSTRDRHTPHDVA
jgi:hypothetical protein